jgi:tetratricopeptide (TPR) repeat protein
MIKKYSGSVIRNVDYANLAIAYMQKSDENGIEKERKDYLVKNGAIYFEKAVNVEPSSPRFYMSLGKAYYAVGAYEAAKYIFTIILKNEPRNSEAAYFLSLVSKPK